MSYAYLGLGSNLGDREAMLRHAVEELASFVRVDIISDLYETEPIGFEDQPWFLNCACAGHTELAPLALLHACKGLETHLGRQPGPRFGPRVIDIDLLAYEDLVLDTGELTLPHPRLHERGFVLAPMTDIAPDWRHPLLGHTVRELYEEQRGQVVRRICWRQPARGTERTFESVHPDQ
jgi:2-amino-4-hydroxy-6-hydroxymethyldihydropteridine diphosphokinase